MRFTIKNNEIIGTVRVRGEKFFSIGTWEKVWQELSVIILESIEKR